VKDLLFVHLLIGCVLFAGKDEFVSAGLLASQSSWPELIRLLVTVTFPIDIQGIVKVDHEDIGYSAWAP
jgi:hypothetical protein